MKVMHVSPHAQFQSCRVSALKSFSTTARWLVEGQSDAPETEAELMDYKQRRLERMAALQSGENALFKETHPRLEHRTETIPETSEVTLYGRIRSIRRHGSFLVFVNIVNQFQEVQAMINWSRVSQTSDITKKQFKLFAKLLEKGDHISITGRATRTNSGQLSIEATWIPELLSPALEPIPEVMTEAEKKIQRRHVDMLVNPEVADTLRLRAAIIAGPVQGACSSDRPELWLKRLVVGGVSNVFEIGPSFRNEGIDGTHNPEFTMCEFYSAYTNLRDLVKRTEDLLSGLAAHCHQLISTELKSLPPVDAKLFEAPFTYVEFVPALESALGFHLPNLASETALPDLITVLKLANIHVPGGAPNTLPKLLDRLAAIYLEPLSFEGPLFITHHPTCMSPLSKSFICPKTGQEVSARAELFINGRELANMYEEENNPDVQLYKMLQYRQCAIERNKNATLEDDVLVDEVEAESDLVDEVMEQTNVMDALGDEAEPVDLAIEEAIDEEAPAVDRSYIQALRAGLPPTGGWGCGIERLVMVFSGAKRISDCLSFGTLKNVVSLNAGTGGEPLQTKVLPKPVGRDKLEALSRRL
ncbi:unnamed protein product [Parascedosporium putredinis]|uniref:Lysyl-tRNA synthetase n=1 Tax=Parascedosporium putredinis TaxID=1442378 RepID=A0A9P1H9Q4_9PEZI|nr:unnamed protein product [Parascedosporium putredinis]CAI8002087.1 unnamed protein product [Parascedosporium putredinis]